MDEEMGVTPSGASKIVLQARPRSASRQKSPPLSPKSPFWAVDGEEDSADEPDVDPPVESPQKAEEEKVATPVKKASKVIKRLQKGVRKVTKFVRVVRLSVADYDGESAESTANMSVNDVIEKLRDLYDPTGEHRDSENEYYTDIALLQRESLKHDPRVR